MAFKKYSYTNLNYDEEDEEDSENYNYDSYLLWFYFYGKFRDPLDPIRPKVNDYNKFPEVFSLVTAKNCGLCKRPFKGNDAYLTSTCRHTFCSCILEHYEKLKNPDSYHCPLCITFVLRLRRFSKKNIGVR